MIDNLDQIVDCLRRLLVAAVAPRSVAFGDKGCHPCYMYLTGGALGAPHADILAEVPEAISSPQQAANLEHLGKLGWYAPLPGDRYWYRFWRVQSAADLPGVALQIQQALETAYGISTGQPLSVQFGSS